MFFSTCRFYTLHVELKQNIFLVQIGGQLPMVTYNNSFFTISQRERQLCRSCFTSFILDDGIEAESCYISFFIFFAKYTSELLDEPGITMFTFFFCCRIVRVRNSTTCRSNHIAMADVFLIHFFLPQWW